MNRIQFWVLTGLSVLVVILLAAQVLFMRMATYDQLRVMQAQQAIQQGKECDLRVRQLAARVYQLSQQTQDQGLKDLLARQQITIAPPQPSDSSAAPTDSSTPATR